MPPGSYWVEEEEQILRDLWYNRDLTADDICRIMMRSPPSIRYKAHALGLESRDRIEAMWRVEQIKKKMQEVIDV